MSMTKAKRLSRKKKAPKRSRLRARQPGDAMTIQEWCEKWRISVAMYYKMRANGLTPRTTPFGTTQRISPEAEAEWARAREAETMKATEAAE